MLPLEDIKSQSPKPETLKASFLNPNSVVYLRSKQPSIKLVYCADLDIQIIQTPLFAKCGSGTMTCMA